MNEPPDRLVHHSLRLYCLILRLYPRGFRKAFGSSMSHTFERLLVDEMAGKGVSGALGVWGTVLAEVVPTAVRAHFDEAFESRFPLPVRVAFAAAMPVAAYIAAVRSSVTTGQYVVLTLWLVMLAVGVLLERGRGWRCSRNAAVASAVGILLPVLNDVLSGRMPPESIRVVPLLVAAAATIGLMFSVYIRLFIEGVGLRRPAIA